MVGGGGGRGGLSEPGWGQRPAWQGRLLIQGFAIQPAGRQMCVTETAHRCNRAPCQSVR